MLPSLISIHRARTLPLDPQKQLSSKMAVLIARLKPKWIDANAPHHRSFIEHHTNSNTWRAPPLDHNCITEPFCTTFCAAFFPDQAEILDAGLKKLTKKHNARFFRDVWGKHATITSTSQAYRSWLNTPAGRIDFNGTHVSTYFDYANIHVFSIGTSLSLVIVTAYPSGRYKYHFNDAMYSAQEPWVDGTFKYSHFLKPQFSGRGGESLREAKLNRLAIRASGDLSCFMNHYLPTPMHGKAIWPWIETIHVNNYQDADLANRLSREYLGMNPREMSFNNDGCILSPISDREIFKATRSHRLLVYADDFITQNDLDSKIYKTPAEYHYKFAYYHIPSLARLMLLSEHLTLVRRQLSYVAIKVLKPKRLPLVRVLLDYRVFSYAHKNLFRFQMIRGGLDSHILADDLSPRLGSLTYGWPLPRGDRLSTYLPSHLVKEVGEIKKLIDRLTKATKTKHDASIAFVLLVVSIINVVIAILLLMESLRNTAPN